MRPRSSETRRWRPGRIALAAAVAAGVALVVAVVWPATPPAAIVADPPRVAPNAWLAAARGEDLPRITGGDAATIDPFAIGAPAAGAAPAATPARLTLSAPKRLTVGEMDDVIVSIDAPASLRRLSFNVSMDADVLQAQSGTQGDWPPDPRATSRIDIAPNDDRVAVEARPGRAGAGSVVRIRVQAMAAGATPVRLTDVVAEDDHGRPVAIAPVDAGASVTTVATPDAPRGRAARAVADMSTSD